MRATPALLFLCVACAGPAQAQSDVPADTPSITVRGEASAEATPDSLLVVFGVVTERPTAADAMSTNSKALADAIAAIKAEGVEPDDIATTSAGLSPVTREAGREASRIVGYRAENQLQVRLQPIERAGTLIGKLVAKGVNDIESLTPVASSEPGLRDRLKGEAARDARRQAEIYAGALDLKLGPVTRIDPEVSTFGARVAKARMAAPSPPPVPIEAGQQTVTEAVRVTFTLQPRP
jgi:uncharacterized protein